MACISPDNAVVGSVYGRARDSGSAVYSVNAVSPASLEEREVTSVRKQVPFVNIFQLYRLFQRT